MSHSSRRSFLKSAGALAASAATAGSIVAVAGGCTIVSGDERSAPRADATSPRGSGFDRLLLDPLGDAMLPASIGPTARRAAVDAFVAWADGYEPVAEEMHGYGYADVRYLPSDPSPAWRAQLEGLDVLARRRHGKSFVQVDATTREAVIAAALRSVRGDRLPAPLQAPHIALALLAHWASSPTAWNLALGANVSPASCRPLNEATTKPLPIGPNGNAGSAT